MADKKLNEVPVVSDIVTIFGKRSNGEIVQIDKSNLATLLGELIGTATASKNGLMSKKDYSKINIVLYTGVYGNPGSGPKLYKLFSRSLVAVNTSFFVPSHSLCPW